MMISDNSGMTISVAFEDRTNDLDGILQGQAGCPPGEAYFTAGGSPLFTACVFGLGSLVDALALETNFDWNQKNDFGQTGLYLAAAAGHETIVQRLLQYSPDVNPLGGKFDYPLHAACFYGYDPIVELLLDHGADVKLGSKKALECSFLGGHESITLMLLKSKIKISDQADYDSTLRQAAEAGYIDVVWFLQRNYARTFGDFGSPKCKAVEAAIFKGRIEVLKRQIQKAAHPKADLPSDAVAIAALGGHDAIIKLLVDNGLDVDQEGPFGTPLRAASIMCHESTVRLLLKLGARLDVSGSFGDPRQAAAMSGHESITKLLLNEGANVQKRGGLYGNALQAAAHHGHQKVVEILLDAGADVYQDGFSSDSFHAASEGGHENIVRLFLERGFLVLKILPEQFLAQMHLSFNENLLRDASPSRVKDFRYVSETQSKPGDWRKRASAFDFCYVLGSMRGTKKFEHEAVSPYLGVGNRRANSRYEDSYALQAAAASGHYSVVEFILTSVCMINGRSYEAMNALKEACRIGHRKLVRFLLTCLDRIRVEKLREALEVAALHGHLAVVDMLIDYEENLGLAETRNVHSEGQDWFLRTRSNPSLSSQVCYSVILPALFFMESDA